VAGQATSERFDLNKGLCLNEEQEHEGLDTASHGERIYNV
jgi:ammonia channel protein AmtB